MCYGQRTDLLALIVLSQEMSEGKDHGLIRDPVAVLGGLSARTQENRGQALGPLIDHIVSSSYATI